MIKQVIVVRKDLNMRKGKIAAQVAHASLKCFLDEMDVTSDENDIKREIELNHGSIWGMWLAGLQTKIVVGCNSEEDIHKIALQCEELSIPHSIIVDAGKTEFHGEKTITCIAVGPDLPEDIDAVTGKYKLL